MKMFRRFAMALSLVAVLGGGIHALAIPSSGCITLTNQTTCESFLCCPNGDGTWTCNPTTPSPPINCK